MPFFFFFFLSGFDDVRGGGSDGGAGISLGDGGVLIGATVVLGQGAAVLCW